MRFRSALLLICTASFLFAQNDRGTITGTVQDPAGALVPNASVVATSADTAAEFKTVTTGTGNYTIPSLPAGIYNLSVEAPGFKKITQNGIEVQVAQIARIDIRLQVGSTTESITITAEAPLLQTENAQQSMVVTDERMNDLPLNFGGGGSSTGSIRSPYQFNLLSPGVNTAANGDTANVNGLQASTFRVQVDGQDATSQNDIGWTSTVAQPSVDMIQEFSLQTSNFAAEYGQIGGGLYNFTTKSGTNDLHGTGYEYFTNEAMNASAPYTHADPRSRKNDFGGTIGGPVWIPKIYNGRNKTFFFFNIEIYRNTVNTAGSYQTLPTAQMRSGNFSQILGSMVGTDPAGNTILANAIYDPASVRTVNGQLVTTQFPGNIIPQSRIDPVAAKIQSLLPAPTNSGLTNNWAQLAGNYHRQAIPAFKIDHTLPDNSKVSFYFSKQTTNQLTSPDALPYPLSAVRVQAIYGTTTRLNYDKSVTPTILWHAGVGFQRFHNPDSSPPQVLQYDAAGQLGFTGSATTPGGFPRIEGFTSGSTTGAPAPAFGAGSSLNFGPTNANSYFDDGLTANSTGTWVHGNHTIKGGAEYRLDSWTDRNSRGAQGILNFLPNETGLPYLQTSSIGGQTVGFSYASFLLGQVDNASVNAVQDPQWRKPAWGLFLQDTWKLTPKLTLDYGLRWDWQTEGHEIHYRTSMFGPTIPNPSAGDLPGGLVYEGYGAGRCDCTFSHAYPYAIAPRLGVAYQIDSKTVFRAGWGVSYGQVPTYYYITNGTLLGVGFNSIAFSNPQFGAAATTLSQGLQYDHSQLYTVSLNPGLVPYPGQLNSPNYFIDPNDGRPPRIMQWSVGFQREMAQNLMLEANWVGNRGAWISQPSGIFATNTLVNLNAINPATLTAKGINPTTTAGQNLLLSTFASGTPQAAGFNIPYAGFPLTATLAQALRPYPQFGTIPLVWAPLDDSWYESLQSKITKRYSHGLTINGAFTWSKAESNPGGTVNNVFNRAINKSIASYDQPFVFNVGYTYEIPTISHNKFIRAIESGWTTGGILSYASGLPIPTPTATTNQNSLLFQTTLMDRVPGQPLYLKNPNNGIDPNSEFAWNPAAWANPAPGTWGTAAPYYSDFRYQRHPNEQMSLGRTFKIREKMSLQIRAEFFNIFNRVYIANPSTAAPTLPQTFSAAGVPTSGWGYINPTSSAASPYYPRNGQLVARFTF